MKHFVNPYKFRAILMFVCAPVVSILFIYITTQPAEDGVKELCIAAAILTPIIFVLLGFLNLFYYKKVNKHLEKIKQEARQEANVDVDQ